MIKMSEYVNRRKALMQTIGETGILILPSANELIRNNDATYSFRQNSDFYYLTGFDEPEAVLVLAPKRKKGQTILFNRVRNRDREIWDGPRAGQQGAKKNYLADESHPIDQFDEILPTLLEGRDKIFCPLGADVAFDAKLLETLKKLKAKIRGGVQSPLDLRDITDSLHEMRLIKSPHELALMQKAVDITGAAHVRAMQVCRPGLYEYELEAELNYIFHKNDARFSAYNAIVGAGKNSCILHYVNNNQRIKNGDLVLIDAGAEYYNYAADITRTFPANGKFTSEQRDIYEIVLAAQTKAIKSIKPKAAWETAQHIVVKTITQGLRDLGILKGNLDQLIEKKAYLPFYMHRSGHWLGLDVHDVGRYRLGNNWRRLQAGMVLTVEPGIYIAADTHGVHKRWHNIGIRIEDDVVVTKKGHRVMSQSIPKTVSDIEAIMRG